MTRQCSTRNLETTFFSPHWKKKTRLSLLFLQGDKTAKKGRVQLAHQVALAESWNTLTKGRMHLWCQTWPPRTRPTRCQTTKTKLTNNHTIIHRSKRRFSFKIQTQLNLNLRLNSMPRIMIRFLKNNCNLSKEIRMKLMMVLLDLILLICRDLPFKIQ